MTNGINQPATAICLRRQPPVNSRVNVATADSIRCFECGKFNRQRSGGVGGLAVAVWSGGNDPSRQNEVK